MFSKTTIHGTIILCFLMVTSTSLFAQTIDGTVTDARTGNALVGANIVQQETSNGVSADPAGQFSLTLTDDAPQKIKVTFVGYKPKLINADGVTDSLNIALVPTTMMSNEVFVKALRVDPTTPMAHDDISKAEIEKENLGQDMPYMINSSPSVTTTSDAGAGVGYTGLRIRGIDQTRINVTVNGIPVNDSESQNVFWVNMPDLASSVENIQVQRGAGTSTNGGAAFGATMNIQTNQMKSQSYGEVNTGIGSFSTRKANVQLGSGLMDNGWQFEGRLSKITSDGYIDRASSDLKSFYLSAAKHGDRSLLRADVFSGKQQTYQAWNGVSESKLQSGDRTYNGLGKYTDTNGETQYYDNQTDNYQQDHYQLHYSYQLKENWDARASLHYTRGRGYYQEYRESDDLSNYDINNIQLPDTTIKQSDLVRQLWLNNRFYGTVFSTEYRHNDRWSITVGGGYNEYDGDHYGKLVWARFAGNSSADNRYYENNAFKTDFNSYIKGSVQLADGLTAYADAQIRHITYKFLGKDRRQQPGGGEKFVDVKQKDRLTFFNPKAGINYSLNERHRVFASFSVANKEPNRDEYVDSTPQNRPTRETLYDLEAGYKGSFNRWSAGANFYYMNYKDQLILTGEINDVGADVRKNVPSSYRAGIELQAGVQIFPVLEWSGNATFSRNKIEEYDQYIDNLDTGAQQKTTYTDTDIAFSPEVIANSEFQFSKNSLTASWSAKYVGRQYLDNTQTLSRSLDPYFVNNLQLGYGWNSIPFVKNIDATLMVNNIFDEKYESNGYTYGYISGGSQKHFNYYFPQAGRNFLLQLSFNF